MSKDQEHYVGQYFINIDKNKNEMKVITYDSNIQDEAMVNFDDDELNTAFIYDPNDSEDQEMLIFLSNCFKKRHKLNDINNRNQRDFQIIYVNQVLKGVKQMLVELN